MSALWHPFGTFFIMGRLEKGDASTNTLLLFGLMAAMKAKWSYALLYKKKCASYVPDGQLCQHIYGGHNVQI